MVCIGKSGGLRVCYSALRQVFFCSGRTLVGGTRAWGDELRFPKTIPWEDIGV